MESKNSFRVIIVIMLLSVSLPMFVHAEQREVVISFAPSKWERIQVPQGFDYDKAYRGSAGRLVILSKVGRLPSNQTVLQWAVDEAKALKQSGMQILVEPKEMFLGNFNWITIESLTGTIKMEQYFAGGKNNTMVAVLVTGDKNIFGNIERQEINEYLFSFKLVPEDSLKSNQRDLYKEAVKEAMESKQVQYKKGDIVKAYLGIDVGKEPPKVEETLQNNPQQGLLFTNLKVALDGQAIFWGDLTNQKYKILRIEKFKLNAPWGQGKADIYMVEVEIIE